MAEKKNTVKKIIKKSRSKKGDKPLHEIYGIDKKDLLFIHKYIEFGFNGAKAWQSIHPLSGLDAARSSAARKLSEANIKRAYREELRFHFQHMGINAEAVLNEIKDIASADIIDFFTEDKDGLKLKKLKNLKHHSKAIRKITITPRSVQVGENVYKQEQQVVFELYDKMKALELLAKATGAYREEEKETKEVKVVVEHKTIKSRADLNN
jgi:hypothetical protein